MHRVSPQLAQQRKTRSALRVARGRLEAAKILLSLVEAGQEEAEDKRRLSEAIAQVETAAQELRALQPPTP